MNRGITLWIFIKWTNFYLKIKLHYVSEYFNLHSILIMFLLCSILRCLPWTDPCPVLPNRSLFLVALWITRPIFVYWYIIIIIGIIKNIIELISAKGISSGCDTMAQTADSWKKVSIGIRKELQYYNKKIYNIFQYCHLVSRVNVS